MANRLALARFSVGMQKGITSRPITMVFPGVLVVGSTAVDGVVLLAGELEKIFNRHLHTWSRH